MRDGPGDTRPDIPLFATKEAGKGTGLGLATVDGILKQSKGGRTFSIYLPRVKGNPAEIVTTPLQGAGLYGSKSILTEYDEMVRALTQAIRERYGYTVVATRNVSDALCFVQDNSNQSHMLLTDTIMPAMNGSQLARQVLALRSEIKVFSMSGYTDQVFMTWESGTPFLQKPFTVQTLTKKVREVLSSSSATKSVAA